MNKFATSLVLLTVSPFVAAAGQSRPAALPDPQTNYQAYTAARLREHFPNVPLRTQDNRSVHFYDDIIKGRTVMIQFMFVNCDRYCPMVTPNLVKVQKELQKRAANQVKLVSITVDPAHDTPAVLEQYAARFRVRPGWQFLTGSKADIDHIRRELGVYDPDDQKTEHMNVLTIGKETTGQWLAIEALAKPDDIVTTVLLLNSPGSIVRGSRSVKPDNGRNRKP